MPPRFAPVRVAEYRNKLRDYGISLLVIREEHGYWNSGGGPSSLDETATSPAGSIIGTIIQPALNLFIFNRQINTGAMLRCCARKRLRVVGRARPDRNEWSAGELPRRW